MSVCYQFVSNKDFVKVVHSRFGCSSPLCSGADSMGHRGHMPPLLQLAGHGGTVSRRTANKELTTSCPDHHKSAHQKRVIVLLEPKKCRGTTKKNFPARAPTFVTDRCPPLSNSFWCHCHCVNERPVRHRAPRRQVY